MNCKSAAGVIKCPQPGGAAYFCTPRGASIIGSEGVDGVHYCFVRGYGGAVFAVSPLRPDPERVQPVAPCAGSRFFAKSRPQSSKSSCFEADATAG